MIVEFKNGTKLLSLVPQVAEKNGVDPELLKAVVEAYYKELNSCISEVKHPYINFFGLGRLKLSRAKTLLVINKIKEFNEKPESNTMSYLIQKKVYSQRRLVILEEGLKKLNNIEQNNEHKKQSKSNLEK